MTLLKGRGGRPFTLRETVMVSFGLAMFAVLGGHIASWVITHAFATTSMATSEIGLGVTARIVNRMLGGA